jgi:coenzyme PQQ biosynthesis protein PqqD
MDENQIPRSADNCQLMKTNDGIAVQCGDKIHTLNLTAGEIFELCDGCRSVSQIVQGMKNRYPGEDIEPIVLDFLDQLHTSGIIV